MQKINSSGCEELIRKTHEAMKARHGKIESKSMKKT